MKKKSWLAIFLALILALSACDSPASDNPDTDKKDKTGKKTSATGDPGDPDDPDDAPDAPAKKVVAVTAITGTETDGENYPVEALMDRDLKTDWNVSDCSGASVIFTLEEAVTITGYDLVTGKDASANPADLPAGWSLFGANGSSAPDQDSSDWRLVHQVKDDTTIEGISRTPYHYNVNAKRSYQHYMLTIDSLKGGLNVSLSEFVPDYDNADNSFVAAGAFVPGDFAGSSYIYDGWEYELAVGDTWSMYHPLQAWGDYYAYTWAVTEGSENVCLDRNGPTCYLTALCEGEITIEAALIQTVMLGYTYKHYEDIYTFTVKLVPKTGTNDPNHGDISDGACPRCHGSKTVGCMVCYGDGKLSNGSACSACTDGEVTCTTCHGTGKWPK